jgi:folate-binding protein YgfZ
MVTSAVAEALYHGAAVAEAGVADLSVSGSGALLCMQGMLTNDVEGSGSQGFTYGAALTPKGMIITDLWVARQHEEVRLFVPSEGKPSLLDMFARSLPPRLARSEDRSAGVTVLQVIGPKAAELARDAGFDVPEPGQSAISDTGSLNCHVARPELEQPFGLQIACNPYTCGHVLTALGDAGVVHTENPALHAARVIAGWPSLGAEIDTKTLPQEVRFDDIGGVSYTKGCFTGQETVARVHFRGRINRWLVGLAWDAEPDPADPEITQGGKTVGRVSSMVWLPDTVQVIGLGVVRREVSDSTEVSAAGTTARVCTLPFDLH